MIKGFLREKFFAEIVSDILTFKKKKFKRCFKLLLKYKIVLVIF